ncbi:MAG TPA: circularly permuted type 2 ATP-grasp protein, partial [Verrucomicrobiae bacterium]|nr:circularly permuted type 2 ATP-grasp protein [Verrucomicrobiae bacterium]
MSQTTAAETPLPYALLEGYPPGRDVFDEAVSTDGKLHSHYARFFQALEAMDSTELNHRWELSRRLLREQGVTYNAYDDRGNSREKQWQLDPIPMVISAEEWGVLEAGLIQRATLMNKILADCYGGQELIRSRSLP